MTEDQKGEDRARMRHLLQDAAELACKINTSIADFIWEAARAMDYADGEPEPEDFDEARDRYCELEDEEDPEADEEA